MDFDRNPPAFSPRDKVLIGEDISAVVTMLNWDGEGWTYTASYFHSGEYRAATLYDYEMVRKPF